MKLPPNVVAEFRAAAAARGLSQPALAAKAGLSERTVHSVLNGIGVRAASVQKVAAALGVDPAAGLAPPPEPMTLVWDLAGLRWVPYRG